MIVEWYGGYRIINFFQWEWMEESQYSYVIAPAIIMYVAISNSFSDSGSSGSTSSSSSGGVSRSGSSSGRSFLTLTKNMTKI